MKKYPKFFYICYFIAFFLFACSENKVAQQGLAPKDFEKRLTSQQGVVLDVRTPEEYKEGHLAQSINIDYKADNFKASLAGLDKNKPYYIYCKAGVRSEKAAQIMQEMGFTKLYNLDGGIDAWKAEGMPLQK